ncbi:MAG: class I SAM-dependent methyltransferase [Phycisphaerales bacterium]
MSTDPSIDTDARLIESVCDSLGFPADLSHLLPIVFSECEGLGAMHAPVIRLLCLAGASSRSKIIDLACGKGDLTLAISERFKARITGVDACGALLRQARLKSKGSSSRHRLRFRRADVKSLPPSRHDIALMIGWLGSEHAPSVLRQQVKNGGYYLFDDALPRASMAQARGFVRERIEACGDALISSASVRSASFRKMTAGDDKRIRAGLDAAIDLEPRVAPLLRRWFASFQRHAARIATDHTVGYWLARKAL